MEKPKRVLHVVGAMNRGGTETMLMNLYRNIDRDKVQFDFISFSEEEAHYDKEIENMGGKIIKLPKPSMLKPNKAISDISNTIKENGPYEVVHAHTLFNSGFAVKAAKKSHIKVRVTHAHTTLDNESSLIRKIYTKYMRNIINKNSTNLLACSNEAGKYLFGKDILNKSNYTFFSNLIDYKSILNTKYEDIEKFKNDNDLNNKLVIGHVGTLKTSKNQKFLIEITHFLVNQNYNVKLLLVGDGSMRDELESLVNEYGIEENVIFTGVREDVDVILHSMDIFVFPSIYEGLGLVLLEAQAAGLPCLVSEAIQPEADLKMGLVEKLNLRDSIEAWSNKIIEMYDSKKIDKKTIRNAFDSSDYSTEKCINKLMDIYDINY